MAYPLCWLAPDTPAKTAFELFVDWADGVTVWDTLLEAGKARGLIPAGLGSRDTLRLEAGMPLYGQELDRETTPFEAGLGRVVKFDKPGTFVGERAAGDGQGQTAEGTRGTPHHGPRHRSHWLSRLSSRRAGTGSAW